MNKSKNGCAGFLAGFFCTGINSQVKWHLNCLSIHFKRIFKLTFPCLKYTWTLDDSFLSKIFAWLFPVCWIFTQLEKIQKWLCGLFLVVGYFLNWNNSTIIIRMCFNVEKIYSTFSTKLTIEQIENMRVTDSIQYVIAESHNRYFGFDLNDDIEQGTIYSIIQSNEEDSILNGWMVSKNMPSWVESYTRWLNYEKEDIEKKIPHTVDVYGGKTNEYSFANTENTSSSNSKSESSTSEHSEDGLSKSFNQMSPPKNRKVIAKQTKCIMSDSDDDYDDDNVYIEDNDDHFHICDWASEGRCLTGIELKKCQHHAGCDKYVHHLCTTEWAHANGIDEQTISVFCRAHHPEYQMNLLKLHSVGKKRTFAVTDNQECHSRKIKSSVNETEKQSKTQKPLKHKSSEKDEVKVTSNITYGLNYDIFKSDDFGASLNKNIKEAQPKKQLGRVEVYVSSPFVNELTGIVHWCVVFGSFNDAWMIKANWLGGYVRTVMTSLKTFDNSDILHTGSYHEFNIRSLEFGVDSKWKRVKGPKNKVKTVSRINFVFSCKKGERGSAMTRLKKILDTISWSMCTRLHNPVGEAMYSHLEKYEPNILKYLTVNDTIAEESVKKKITDVCDSNFKRGFNIRYHCHLNQFMVDYDILRVLKNDMRYSSWSELSDDDRKICYKNYDTKKINLPDWNIEEESWND